jgi:hypothetical protein
MQFIVLDITTPGRDPATTWIAISVGILTVVYVTFVRPLRRKKEKDPLERRFHNHNGTLAQQRAVERDMSTLLVELSEMARQMTAQLDTRAAKLELLLKEADERIAALRAGNPRSANSAERGTPDALEGVIVEARAALSPSLPEQRIDPRHAQVYDLADEGLSPPEIARQLGRPSGEIELILALRGDTANGI